MRRKCSGSGERNNEPSSERGRGGEEDEVVPDPDSDQARRGEQSSREESIGGRVGQDPGDEARAEELADSDGGGVVRAARDDADRVGDERDEAVEKNGALPEAEADEDEDYALHVMARIADHVIADVARSQSRKKRQVELVRFRSESNPAGPEPVDTKTPSRIFSEQEGLRRLLAQLDSLPADYREIILLIKVEGLSTTEAAERLTPGGDTLQLASLLQLDSRSSADDLERDHALKMGVDRLVDRAHSSFADLFEDGVVGYRLAGDEDAAELGFAEYFHGDGVCLVEWAERLTAEMPAERLTVCFHHAGLLPYLGSVYVAGRVGIDSAGYGCGVGTAKWKAQ